MGKIHIKCILEAIIQLKRLLRPRPEVVDFVENEYNIQSYKSAEELINDIEIVDIVTPTLEHFQLAEKSIKLGKHVFIEKPVVATPEEAKKLMLLATEASVQVQVGHVERFNPAYVAALPFIKNPMFIETHRLATFNVRGNDVPVVLDLMIHDIDIVLSIVKSEVKRVSANGVSIVNDTPDIANARVEFHNGCVANFTASRISMKNMRKTRFFQQNAYISVDYLDKKSEIIQMREYDPSKDNPFAMLIDLGEKGQKQIYFQNPEIKPNNAIKDELESFAKSIKNNTSPIVSLQDGCNALELAYMIMEKIEK